MPVLESLSWCVTLKEEGPERQGKAACLENPGHREQMFLGLPNIFPFPLSDPAGVGLERLVIPLYTLSWVQGQAEHPLRVQRFNISPIAM